MAVELPDLFTFDLARRVYCFLSLPFPGSSEIRIGKKSSSFRSKKYLPASSFAEGKDEGKLYEGFVEIKVKYSGMARSKGHGSREYYWSTFWGIMRPVSDAAADSS